MTKLSEKRALGNLSEAVYYPHTTVRSPELLKTGLLLWDRVDCIVPNTRFKDRRDQTESVRRATELLVRNQPVSEPMKRAVHGRLENLLEHGLPHWLTQGVPEGWRGTRRYLIYPEKLAHETWGLLHYVKALEWDKVSRDFAVPPVLGLLLMAMLADEMAGKTRRRITDRVAAYSWLSRFATEDIGGCYLPDMNASHLADTFDRLVTIAVDVVDASRVPMKRLVALREREAREGDLDLATFRRNLLTRVNKYVEAITSPGTSSGDQEELRRQYRQALEADLRVLRAELGVAKREVLLSKEVGITALATAGVVLTGVGVPLLLPAMKSVGIGAVLRSGSKYKNSRRKAYDKSALSWLYLAKHKWQ
jgi:hypothetical protein